MSFILLIVFLFNVGGYYLAFLVLEYKTNQALSVRIDHDQYDESETITIKIPLSLPYPIQEHDYTRVDGDFEYQGEYFKLVKHKLEKDTLYVVCIKNHDQKQMQETITDYVKLSNDLPGNAKKALSFFSKLLKDFRDSETPAPETSGTWVADVVYPDSEELLSSLSGTILSPPPKA
jgi:hypothetical protein